MLLLFSSLALLFIGLIVILKTTALRMQWVTQPLFKRLQKILPPVSETERDALEAGDVWWEAELFAGKPNWKKMTDTVFPQLNQEEQAFIDNQVEKLCGMLDDFEIVYKLHDLPAEVWKYIKQEKFLGMIIPKQYGGLGFSALAHSTVVAKLMSRSVSAAVNVMVPNSLGPAELLLHYGTDEQKNYYLPRLASGKEIPCFGLTGTESGSDAAAMLDTGVVCKGIHEGKEVIGIRLNFDKRYITLAPIATVIGLAFKLFDPEHLLGAEPELGITLALLPANHTGVEVGKRHLPIGLAFMNGPVRGKDVFIPFEWIIGGSTNIGRGWRMLMECLSIGRSISLPSLSAAIGQLSYRTTGAYALIRQQFRLPIGHFEGIEEVLARIGGFTYILEATRRCTAAAVDTHIKPSVASAIAKYHMSEMGRQAINDAMDIHGGRGIQLGPRNYLGLGYMGIPVAITVEGANILTRNLIIFGQGAMRCHPYIQAEMQALASSDVNAFDNLLLKHMRYTARNFLATFLMGIGGVGFYVKGMCGPAIKYYQQLTRMSAALAFIADVALFMLGGSLKRKERLSARLGDVLSYLYIAACVLKYYQDNKQTPEDFLHMEWAVQYCLQQIQRGFDKFFANFPNRLLGYLLRFIVFPLGRSYFYPKDKLNHQLARMMLTPSQFRNRLTQYCYVGDSTAAIGRIENAFNKLFAIADINKKIQDAVRNQVISKDVEIRQRIELALAAKIITPVEAEQLREAEAARADAIQVDEFEQL